MHRFLPLPPQTAGPPSGLSRSKNNFRIYRSISVQFLLSTALVEIANYLDKAVAGLGRKPLKVLVQVNTSGEESKSGINPSNCVEPAKHVKHSCPNLIFSGLMTIGMRDYSSKPENFQALSKCSKGEVSKALDLPQEQFELSMGISGDFEQAVRDQPNGDTVLPFSFMYCRVCVLCCSPAPPAFSSIQLGSLVSLHVYKQIILVLLVSATTALCFALCCCRN